jgi:hypothetical protein
MVEVDAAVRVLAHPAQPGMAPDPDAAVGVLVDRAHQVACQAARIVDPMSKAANALAAGLDQSQSVTGAEPDPAPAVHVDRMHGAVPACRGHPAWSPTRRQYPVAGR